jgi:hypothetical protein
MDSYSTMKAFHDILMSVTEEYEAVRVGGSSPVVMIGGQIVGGAEKAAGTTLVFSDAPWYYQFNSAQLSCCDCFHPSGLGQDTLARMMKNGLACSRLNPCCRDTGDPLADAKCSTLQRKRTFYRGLL